MKTETLLWLLPMLAALAMGLWAGIGWGLNRGYDEGVSVATGVPQTQTVGTASGNLRTAILLLVFLSIAIGFCVAMSFFRDFPADFVYYLCAGGCGIAVVVVVSAIKKIIGA